MKVIPEDWEGTLRSITAPVILIGLVFLVLGSVAIALIACRPVTQHSFLLISHGIGILFFLSLIWVKPDNLMLSGEQRLRKIQEERRATQKSKKSRQKMSKTVITPPKVANRKE